MLSKKVKSHFNSHTYVFTKFANDTKKQVAKIMKLIFIKVNLILFYINEFWLKIYWISYYIYFVSFT